MPSPRRQKTLLGPEESLTHLLEECRMVLPGIQAIFGFQLIAVFNRPFRELLSQSQQVAHLAALILMAVAIGLVLAPAAYHRLVEPDSVSRFFLLLASRFLTAGMVVFMTAMLIDIFLIASIVLKNNALAATVTGGVGIVLLGLWFVLPVYCGRRKE